MSNLVTDFLDAIAAELQTRSAVRRQQFVEEMEQGSAGFVERVEKYGRNERGEKLTLTRWYREYLGLIGDLRLHRTLTSGPAQVGKTLGHTLLQCDCLTHGKLNAGWIYDTAQNLQRNAPMQFRPIVENWVNALEQAGRKFIRKRDRTMLERYQVEGANAIFAYVSTSRPSVSGAGGTAAAGSAVVSFQADILFLEERSQYPPGAADPLPRRLDASILPSRPIRELGTPGGGQGIEAELARADYWFYPHYECENCGKVAPLDPKGCLLKTVRRVDSLGRPVTSYFSLSGRPVEWWHADEQSPRKSAYFGCAECGHPLSEDQRRNPWFQCRRTGLTVPELLAKASPQDRVSVGIQLSPLTRQTAYNLAAEIIDAGMSAATTADWQQQMLGHGSESEGGGLTLEILKSCMGNPAPQRKPDYTLAGIDVGRAEDWLVVVDFYLPLDCRKLSAAEISEKTIRVLRFAADISRDQIHSLLEEFGVSYGLIDNEPSRESSMKIAAASVLELGDQIGGQKDVALLSEVVDGGLTYACWKLRNDRFLQQVQESFLLTSPDDGLPLYRLPADWERWIVQKSDRSPLKHLSGPFKEGGKWHRPKDKIDDLYFALAFCEAAFYLRLSGHGQTQFRQGHYRH